MRNREAFWVVYRLQSALNMNQLVYWLGRIPLLKRLFTDRVFSAYEGKVIFSVLATLYRGLFALGAKALYLAIACVLPVSLWMEGTLQGSSAFSLWVWVFFWLSFVAGCLLQPACVEVSHLKYTCVRLMGMEAKRFVLITLVWQHLTQFAGFLPFLVGWSVFAGEGWLTGLYLSLLLALLRVVGEGVHLWLYRQFHRIVATKVWYILLLCSVCTLAAYLPPMFGVRPPILDVLFHPLTLVVLAIAALVCGRWLYTYSHYYELVVDTCKADALPGQDKAKKAQAAQFDGVKLRDSDLDGKTVSPHLKGWDYLQATFFHRHRRMLYKPFVIVLSILGLVTVAGCILILLLCGQEDWASEFSQITQILPVLVFFIYIMDNTVGERMCRAMFYNCDLALLRYGFYRERGAVLKNFFLRYRAMCLTNLTLSVAVCAMFAIFTLVGGGRPPLADALCFCAAVLSLGVFFATHTLGSYYLFQPYTSDLNTKNPFFKALNIAMYVVCYICMQIRTGTIGFSILVLAVTVVYSVGMLALVARRAPTSFRVK